MKTHHIVTGVLSFAYLTSIIISAILEIVDKKSPKELYKSILFWLI